MTGYDDPADIARLVGACPRPLLVGLDVDGVLAPIVDHADDATLLDGMGAAVSAVAALEDPVLGDRLPQHRLAREPATVRVEGRVRWGSASGALTNRGVLAPPEHGLDEDAAVAVAVKANLQ